MTTPSPETLPARSLAGGALAAVGGILLSGYRGQGPPDVKSLIVGGVLAVLVALGIRAGRSLALARGEVVADDEALDRAETVTALLGRPALSQALLAAERRAPQDAGPGTAHAIARAYASERWRDAEPARRYAASAVYLGLAGTLMGLTTAVLGLQGLGGQVDPNAMKDQILAVVGGFGGSFVAALTGVFGTLLVNRALSLYEVAVERVSDGLETHLAEVTLPGLSTGDKTADALKKAIVDAVDGGFVPLVTTVAVLGDTLRESATASAGLVGAIADASGTLREQTASLDGAIASLKEAANLAKESSAEGARATALLVPATKGLSDAYAAQKPAVDRLAKALTDVDDLADAFDQAQDAAQALKQASGELPTRTQALVEMMRGELLASQGRIEESLKSQAQTFRQAVEALVSCTQGLHALVGELDERLRDAELGIPADRLVAELSSARSVATETLTRELGAVAASRSRLEEAERHVAAIAREIDEANRASAASADAARQASVETKGAVDGLRAQLDRTPIERVGAWFKRPE